MLHEKKFPGVVRFNGAVARTRRSGSRNRSASSRGRTRFNGAVARTRRSAGATCAGTVLAYGFNGAVARTRRSEFIGIGPRTLVTASMEPSRERDGVLVRALVEPIEVRLQWSRRANATECLFATSSRSHLRLLQWSRRANATECFRGARRSMRATASFNGAVARTRRSVDATARAHHVPVASMEPSRERDGVWKHELQRLLVDVGFNGAVARTRRSGPRAV